MSLTPVSGIYRSVPRRPDALGLPPYISIDSLLSEGGQATVWRGVLQKGDSTIPVAIKIYKPEGAEGAKTELGALKRVFNQTGYSHGDLEDGSTYILFPLHKGGDLTHVQGRLENERAYVVSSPVRSLTFQRHVVRYALSASSALIPVHKAGVVHRDVKPANICLEHPADKIDPYSLDFPPSVAIDFGIARYLECPGDDLIRGSLSYMAPEQIKGAEVTSATDVYALGRILANFLVGRMIDPNTPIQEIHTMLSSEECHATYLARVGLAMSALQICDDLKAIVMKALSFNPEDRFKNAESFTGCVIQWLDNSRWTSGFTKDEDRPLTGPILPIPSEEIRTAALPSIVRRSAANE